MLLLEKRTVAAYYEEQMLEMLQLLLAKQLHTSLKMHQPCPLFKQHMLTNILIPSPFPSSETSCVLTRTMYNLHMISVYSLNTILMTCSHK